MDRLELTPLLAARDFARLKARVNGANPTELQAAWLGLPPLEKLAVFKLLGPEAALAFFARLGSEDRYFVFCGFEPGSIAPLTEDLPPGRAALFERLGPDQYRDMLRQLSA